MFFRLFVTRALRDLVLIGIISAVYFDLYHGTFFKTKLFEYARYFQVLSGIFMFLIFSVPNTWLSIKKICQQKDCMLQLTKEELIKKTILKPLPFFNIKYVSENEIILNSKLQGHRHNAFITFLDNQKVKIQTNQYFLEVIKDLLGIKNKPQKSSSWFGIGQILLFLFVFELLRGIGFIKT